MPLFQGDWRFFAFVEEMIEISTEVKAHVSAKGELRLLAAPSPGSQ